MEVLACFLAVASSTSTASNKAQAQSFEIVEAKISDIQAAIIERRVTSTDVVKLYLERFRAYNGRCVNEPNGVLGPVTPFPGVRSLNALIDDQPAASCAAGLGAGRPKSQKHD